MRNNIHTLSVCIILLFYFSLSLFEQNDSITFLFSSSSTKIDAVENRLKTKMKINNTNRKIHRKQRYRRRKKKSATDTELNCVNEM